MEKKELAERIVEYASNYHWNLEGWGDNVPEDDDLEKELTGIVTFVFEELDKAREEGRREGSEITSRYISDFVKSESGKSGRKEILEYIEELSKLKQ